MNTQWKTLRRLLVALTAIALLAAACSSDDETTTSSSTEAPDEQSESLPENPDPEPDDDTESEPDTEGEDSVEEDPEPLPEPESVTAAIEESFVGATLALYPGSESIVDGEVMVYWNNGSNGTLIAIYHGEGMSDLSQLCPGNSIATSAGFVNVTNTPADAGACDSFPTPTSSLRTCTGDVVLYETAIPNDSEGTLFGSLEWNSEAGIAGMTSQATNVADTPEILFEADVFTLPAKFTTDGSTEITCGEIITA